MQLEKQGHDEIIWQLLKFAVYNKTKFLKCITQKKLWQIFVSIVRNGPFNRDFMIKRGKT
jgi:hypothetical protein